MRIKICLIFLLCCRSSFASTGSDVSSIEKAIDCSLYALVVHHYIKDFNSRAHWYSISELWLDKALKLGSTDEIYALRSIENLRSLRVINERHLVLKVSSMYANNNCKLNNQDFNGDI